MPRGRDRLTAKTNPAIVNLNVFTARSPMAAIVDVPAPRYDVPKSSCARSQRKSPVLHDQRVVQAQTLADRLDFRVGRVEGQQERFRVAHQARDEEDDAQPAAAQVQQQQQQQDQPAPAAQQQDQQQQQQTAEQQAEQQAQQAEAQEQTEAEQAEQEAQQQAQQAAVAPAPFADVDLDATITTAVARDGGGLDPIRSGSHVNYVSHGNVYDAGIAFDPDNNDVLAHMVALEFADGCDDFGRRPARPLPRWIDPHGGGHGLHVRADG